MVKNCDRGLENTAVPSKKTIKGLILRRVLK